MQCQDCGGEVDLTIRVIWTPKGGCWFSHGDLYACKSCHRLHWDSGLAAVSNEGHMAFYENGEAVIRDKTTREIRFSF